jgi:hypothetical protein
VETFCWEGFSCGGILREAFSCGGSFGLRDFAAQPVFLYITCRYTHQRLVEVQFGRYQKTFCRSDLWSKSLMC